MVGGRLRRCIARGGRNHWKMDANGRLRHEHLMGASAESAGYFLRQGQNQWQWAKILDAGTERRSDDDHICLAYMRDRIAVSFPRTGVKVWVWLKGRNVLMSTYKAIHMIFQGHGSPNVRFFGRTLVQSNLLKMARRCWVGRAMVSCKILNPHNGSALFILFIDGIAKYQTVRFVLMPSSKPRCRHITYLEALCSSFYLVPHLISAIMGHTCW